MMPLRYLAKGKFQERKNDVEFNEYDAMLVGEADGAGE